MTKEADFQLQRNISVTYNENKALEKKKRIKNWRSRILQICMMISFKKKSDTKKCKEESSLCDTTKLQFHAQSLLPKLRNNYELILKTEIKISGGQPQDFSEQSSFLNKC